MARMMNKALIQAIAALTLLFIGTLSYLITAEAGLFSLILIWAGLLMLALNIYLNYSVFTAYLVSRQCKEGLGTFVMVILFACILGFVSVMSVKHKYRVDLTKGGRYTLSAQTKKVLSSLKRDVEVIAFYRNDERTRQSMVDLLLEFSYYSPRFSFRFIDPDRQPAVAASYNVTSYRTTLFLSGNKREVVGFESEEKLLSALIRVLRDKEKVVYFLKGHGENTLSSESEDGYAMALDDMNKAGYRIEELLLLEAGNIPKDASLVIISAPELDLLGSELSALADFLSLGGSVLLQLDPTNMPGTEEFLLRYGISLTGEIIVDNLSKLYGAGSLTPVIKDYNTDHVLTADFNLATFFPLLQGVSIEVDQMAGRYVLASSGKSSFGVGNISGLMDDSPSFREGVDTPGPLPIAVVSAVRVVEKDKESVDSLDSDFRPPYTQDRGWGKLLVIGDSDFANNTNINLAGNRDFFLNMVSWLNEDDDLISIRKPPAGVSPMALTGREGRVVFYLPVVVIPFIIVVIAAIVIYCRRKEERLEK